MGKRDFMHKTEVKKAYHEFLNDRTVNWKKHDFSRNIADYETDIDIYKKDKEIHKYLLCIVDKDADFETVHTTVRAAINPSKHNDLGSVYVQYVIKKKDLYNEIKEHLLYKANPNTTQDYREHRILYHIHYLKDGKLERIH